MHEPGCVEFFNQLSDYIDGKLAAPLCAELERHLTGCPDCRIVVDTTRKTVNLYRHSGPAELPPAVKERLWQALEQAGCWPGEIA